MEPQYTFGNGPNLTKSHIGVLYKLSADFGVKLEPVARTVLGGGCFLPSAVDYFGERELKEKGFYVFYRVNHLNENILKKVYNLCSYGFEDTITSNLPEGCIGFWIRGRDLKENCNKNHLLEGLDDEDLKSYGKPIGFNLEGFNGNRELVIALRESPCADENTRDPGYFLKSIQ